MRFIYAIALISAFIVLSGCCIFPQPPSPAQSLVPSSASSVMYVKLGAVLSDPEMRELYRTAFPDRNIDDEFQPVRDVGGIDPRNVEEASVFTLDESGKAKTAMILKGPFDRGAIESSLSGNSQWAREDYKGRYLFRSNSATGPLAASFAGGDLVLGGEQAVKAAIDVEGGAPSLQHNAALTAILAKFDQGSLIMFAKEIRPEERGSLTAGTPLNASDAFSNAQASGAGIQKSGTSVSIRGVIAYGSAADAMRGKAAVDVAVGFMALFSAQGSSTQSLLSKVQDSADSEMLIIDLQGTSLQELTAAKAELDAASREQP